MQFAILGPLVVSDATGTVEVAGSRVRRLTVRLAVDVGRPVSAGDLVDAVWGDDPPAETTNALQSLVSRLRRALGGADLVQQIPGGYRLAVDPGSTDVAEFGRLTREGTHALRDGDSKQARSALVAALSLWRGGALLDAGDAEYSWSVRARLEEQRLEALGLRIEADLGQGLAAETVGELEELTHAFPLRERFTGLLMSALAATGRTAEGLAIFERTRAHLADELGTDPSTELQEVHLRLLRGEVATRRTGLTNLRPARTSFIGRTDEGKRISSLLEAGRLVTVVGPGGAGKTRLSSEIASAWVDRVADGVWFVPLAPVTDPADVATTVLGSLGLRESNVLDRRGDRAAGDTVARLVEALAAADSLLVVDNCEHLIGAVATLVDLLLGECPNIRVLATSREPLGIDGESLCVLPSLTLPEEAATAAEAGMSPAVQLFADRAESVRAGFEVTDENVGDVVQIVRRLDGLPLAIELAAARLRVLPISDVAARLSDRFRLLTGGSRTALPRHQTLRAVVQWSWDLLGPDERLLAERLAVFPAGATTASAGTVCADGRLAAAAVPDLLDALVDKSLLQLDEGTTTRYRMLETIREFGLERLAERGDVAAALRAHADHYAALAAEAEPWLRTSEQLSWLRLMRTERDNLLSALRFLGDSGDAAATMNLAESLIWFWALLGNNGEAATWLRFALAVPGDTDPVQRAMVEAGQALSSFEVGIVELDELEDGRGRLRQLLSRLDTVDPDTRPVAALFRPILALLTDQKEQMDEYVASALASSQPWVRATVLAVRASLYENDGNVAAMRVDVEQAMTEFEKIGDRWGLSATLSSVGQVRTLDGDVDGAIDAFLRAGSYLEEIGASSDANMLHLRLTDLYLRKGDIDNARRHSALAQGAVANAAVPERLLASIAVCGIARAEGNEDELRRLRDSLVDQLEESGPAHPFHGHGHAVISAMVASIDLGHGRLESVPRRLADAYTVAIGTKDKPILAVVGVVTAELARSLGHPVDGAEVLGASARLRGAEDPTDINVREVTGKLRDVLGPEFDPAYERGRALGMDAAIARLDPALFTEPDRAT